MKALVDMDLIVYRVGAACDNWYYEFRGDRYDSSKELKSQLKRETKDTKEQEQLYSQAERKRDPESWEETKSSVITFTEQLISEFDDYQGYISGKGNFRHRYATILPYKGTRSDDTRPVHYDAIRQLLVDAYDAKVAQGMEADDCLGLAQTSADYLETCIVTVDKDLDMIPGVHYNWERDLKYEVEELDGVKKFYKQMLTGDMTDNILGLYGVGPKSALLKNIQLMEHEEDMQGYVAEQYRARFGSYDLKFLEENAKLLWILRSDKQNPFVGGEYWKE